MSYKSGRHFLQIPGPSNVPDRILRAMDYPTMDHRGPDFGEIGLEILAGVKKVFGTDNHVIVYPSSGTGAWEAALVNTLSPGDKVLMFETGQFATLWQELAEKHGLEVEFIDGDWRHGVDAGLVEEKLKADSGHSIKAVCMVHNETSTGVASNIATAALAVPGWWSQRRRRAFLDAATVAGIPRNKTTLVSETAAASATLALRFQDEWNRDLANDVSNSNERGKRESERRFENVSKKRQKSVTVALFGVGARSAWASAVRFTAEGEARPPKPESGITYHNPLILAATDSDDVTASLATELCKDTTKAAPTTFRPTLHPTIRPTRSPTDGPTMKPTRHPTAKPTKPGDTNPPIESRAAPAGLRRRDAARHECTRRGVSRPRSLVTRPPGVSHGAPQGPAGVT